MRPRSPSALGRAWRLVGEAWDTEVAVGGSISTQAVTRLATAALSERAGTRPESVQLTCVPLLRGEAACGLHFTLRGPRNVLLTAIWDADALTLWCYDSSGKRFSRLPGGTSDFNKPV